MEVFLVIADDQGTHADAVLSAVLAAGTLAACRPSNLDAPPQVQVRAAPLGNFTHQSAIGMIRSGPRGTAMATVTVRHPAFQEAGCRTVLRPIVRIAQYRPLQPRAAVVVHVDATSVPSADAAAAAGAAAAVRLVARNPRVATAFASQRTSVNVHVHTGGIERLVRFGPPTKVVVGNGHSVAAAWSLS